MSSADLWGASGAGFVLLQAEPTNTVWEGWGSVIMIVGGMVLGALLIALVIWQVFKVAQTRIATSVTIAQDEAYRQLAEQSTSVQEQTMAHLDELRNGMAELRQRVAAIEKILSEVG